MIKDLVGCERDGTGLPVPTLRQYALRAAIEAFDRWAKGSEICSAMALRGFDYGRDPRKAYKEINRDVRFLNVCGRFDKMILGDRGKGYKMATREEFDAWARSKRSEMIGGLEYLGALCRNAKLDGQEIMNIFSQPCLREYRDCFAKGADGAPDGGEPRYNQ